MLQRRQSVSIPSIFTFKVTYILSTETGRVKDPNAEQYNCTANDFFCSSCRLLQVGRPCYDNFAKLISAWKNLQVCLPDGRTLVWLMERIVCWRAKLSHTLETNYLSAALKLTSHGSLCSSSFCCRCLLFDCLHCLYWVSWYQSSNQNFQVAEVTEITQTAGLHWLVFEVCFYFRLTQSWTTEHLVCHFNQKLEFLCYLPWRITGEFTFFRRTRSVSVIGPGSCP